MEKITEQPSPYRHLETWSSAQLLEAINCEDQKVAQAIQLILPDIAMLVDVVVPRMEQGCRLFYIGAGTSGRLGILDASECPPTFGVPSAWVTGIIAGGDKAIRQAVEGAEDNKTQAWEDLKSAGVSDGDVVVGITASGSTPYVVHGLQDCKTHGITTACITCNPDTPVSKWSDYPIVVLTGPEFLTGSTRLKAGTAQKMVLNMLSTAVMIRLGRVRDNRMVDMQLTNAKLMERGINMLMHELQITEELAKTALIEAGSVREVLRQHLKE